MQQLLQQIYGIGIVPVIALQDANDAVPLAKALVAGGLPVAEVTFRTEAAFESIRRMTTEVPELLVGAGTVLTTAQVDQAIEAGAAFMVSPGFNPETVRYALSKGVPFLPGTETPGEMEQAMALGLSVVKFFPAEQNGGLAKLKALAGPYGNLRWMPTGGISEKNLGEYLAFDRIVACGGSWMVPANLIAEKNWAAITALTKQAVDTMLGLSIQKVVLPHAEDFSDGERAWLKALFPTQSPADFTVEQQAEIGEQGCIVVETCQLERAVFHLSARGIRFGVASCCDQKKQYVDSIDTLFGYKVRLTANR